MFRKERENLNKQVETIKAFNLAADREIEIISIFADGGKKDRAYAQERIDEIIIGNLERA